MSRLRPTAPGPARLLVALVCAAFVVVAASAPAAAQSRPAGRMTLASQTPWVTGDGTFVVRLDLDGVVRRDRLELVVGIHRGVTSRSQFARTLDGDLLGRRLTTVTTPLSDIVPDAARAVAVRLPVSELPGVADDRTGGVFPVAVQLRAAGERRPLDQLVTYLVRLPDSSEAPPLSVAWVQSVAAAPALRPDGDVALTGRARGDLAAVVRALGASEVPLTVAPLPETLDALADEGEQELLDDLAAAAVGRQVLLRPYAGVNSATLLALGLSEELLLHRTRGIEVVEDLLGVRPDTRTSLADPGSDESTLAQLRELGVDRLVLQEESLEPLARRLTLARPFVLEGAAEREMDAVVADPGLSSHFTGADDDVLAAHHLLADLAVLHFDAPGIRRGVVVQPPARWRPSPAFLATALDGLADSPLLAPATLDQLFASVPAEDEGDEPLVRRLLVEEVPRLGVPTGQLERRRHAVRGFASMADDVPEVELLRRLLLVAQAADMRPSRRRAYLAGVDQRLAAELEGVQVLDRRSFRLTAREGTLPLTLVNHNDYPVRVALGLTSDKLEFLDGDPERRGRFEREVVLDPGNTVVVVDVRTRTPGAFPLLVDLRSPDGRIEVGAARLTIRSTAFSGVGLVLSAGAGLFLLLWWGRHWRTTRRDRRLVPAS